MTKDPKTQQVLSDSPTGYGHQVRGSRKGLGGDPPNNLSRRRPAPTVLTVEAPPANDVPTCPLCHTPAIAVTAHALREGAYWRCTRCGQMWDAIRLQTAADYARHAKLLSTAT